MVMGSARLLALDSSHDDCTLISRKKPARGTRTDQKEEQKAKAKVVFVWTKGGGEEGEEAAEEC